MFANMDCDLLPLVVMSIHQDPLNQVVAVLVAGDVDEGDARTVRMCGCDGSQIMIQKFDAANLETFLNHL